MPSVPALQVRAATVQCCLYGIFQSTAPHELGSQVSPKVAVRIQGEPFLIFCYGYQDMAESPLLCYPCLPPAYMDGGLWFLFYFFIIFRRSYFVRKLNQTLKRLQHAARRILGKGQERALLVCLAPSLTRDCMPLSRLTGFPGICFNVAGRRLA